MIGSGVGISSPGSASLVQAIRKAADQSKTTDTVLADDDTLTLPVKNGAQYIIDALIMVTSPSAVPDFKFVFTDPAGANWFGYIASGDNAGGQAFAAVQYNTASSVIAIAAGTSHYIRVRFAIAPTADGNVTLQWAQNTSDANAVTVSLGSYITAIQVG